MISKIANIIQIISLFFAFFSLIKNYKLSLQTFILSNICNIICFLLLVFAFVISDFSLQNVFLNSSNLMPLIYRFGASWGSHEGSMFLWLGLLSAVNLATIRMLQKNVQPYFIKIQSLGNILFGSFIFFISNPFDTFSLSPAQGVGLNPLLQDIALVIHPPILYLGYICYSPIYGLMGSCILQNINICKDNIKIIKKYSSIGLTLMSCGISLGSWWAYRELGWGGYWFFDPVENISLIPWLFAIALHHSLVGEIKNNLQNNIKKAIVIISLLIFPVIIFGTFLIRSGLLVSVHTFSYSPERGAYIFTIFALYFLFSLYLIFIKLRNYEIQSKENKIIIYSNILWLISAGIMLFSVIFPVLYSEFTKTNVNIDIDFFKKFLLPIFIALGFIAFFSRGALKKFEILSLLLISTTIFLSLEFYNISSSILQQSSLIIGCFLMLQNIYYIFEYRGIKKIFVAHFGFALLMFSISFNSLMQTEIKFRGKIGDQFTEGNFDIRLDNIEYGENENYVYQKANFWITYNNSIVILQPEYRLYKLEKSISTESDIFSKIAHDLYAVIVSTEQNSENIEIIEAVIYYRPMISFIWLAGFLISISFLPINFFYKRSRIKY